ncbi:hypothetical protein [Streptomyces sp. E5N298]|uniref:hypothetical protein n=1 Tax=Streptomyces sp. E5N298 TaxID=1851983 RepID=UPI000EF56EAB|nr:hypothetical protein [Streptomyces sp. E5N298]
MADEQDKWLDRETAELLLRGEPLEGVDPASRDRAGRLVLALGALSAPPPPTGEELPGEAAALAAFRKVRAERADASTTASAALGHGTAPRPADAGLVRIGGGARRPHRSRPLRLGLAAALTVGMIGGVAAAAGTGVLPTPFDGTEPEPAATVSAAVSPGRPSAPPSPLEGVQGGAVPGTTPGTPAGGTARDGGRAGDRDTDDRDAGGSDGRRKGLTASCRKLRAGKELDTAHRRALKEAAGGASRVVKYCGSLLAGNEGGGRHGGDAAEPTREGELRRDTGDGDGRDDKSGKGDKGDRNDKGSKNGKSDKGDKSKGGKGSDGKKGGHGDQGDDGDDGGNGDGDDADADIPPPARDPQPPDRPDRPDRPHRSHGPHARSAYAPPTPTPTSTA